MSAIKLTKDTNIPNASSQEKISISSNLNESFKSKSYQIQQPFIQITAEGYKITNAEKTEEYVASRPRSWMKNFLAHSMAWIGATVSFMATLAGIIFLSADITKSLMYLSLAVSFLVATYTLIFLGKLLKPKRKATLRTVSDSLLLSIMPSSGWFIFNHEYHILDKNGEKLALYKKKWAESLFRRHWKCYDLDNNYLFTASEDSIVMSVLRRVLPYGAFIPLHFVFHKQGGKSFGSFKRRYSLRDKYILDFDDKATDPWLMVASSILLDTGEER